MNLKIGGFTFEAWVSACRRQGKLLTKQEGEDGYEDEMVNLLGREEQDLQRGCDNGALPQRRVNLSHGDSVIEEGDI